MALDGPRRPLSQNVPGQLVGQTHQQIPSAGKNHTSALPILRFINASQTVLFLLQIRHG